MDIGLAQKMGALALPVKTVERAFALTVIECIEHDLYIYPTPTGSKLLAGGYSVFCVLPCEGRERDHTKEKLLRVLENIACEEECIADTSTREEEDSRVCTVYFRFRK